MAVAAASSPFVWGAGGAALSPDELARRRQMAEALASQGGDYSPVGHWTQGVARVMRGLRGGLETARLDKAEKENRSSADDAFGRVSKALMGGGAAPEAASPVVSRGDYLSSVEAAESGGDPNARNPRSSATGPFQFLEGTWNDIATRHKDLGLTPDGRTDPVQARKAMQVFTDENATHLGNAGIKADRGNLYAAHFLGAGGAVPVLQAPDDAPVASLVPPEVIAANPNLQNMTAGDFKAWAASKGGGQRAPGNQVAQAGGGVPAQGGMGGISPDLLAAASNEWLSDSQRSVVNALIKQQMEQSDPMRALQMEKGRLEIDQMRNPRVEPTNEMRNLEWRAQQAGLQPGTPEYGRFMTSGGRDGINVNVDTGTIPAGYQAVRDDQGRTLRYEPVPGGPADKSGADAAAAESQAVSGDIITTATRKAREAMNAPGILPTTGTLGSLAGKVAETNAAEVRRQVEVLKSNARIENLQAMRAASPTGGALGNVSDSEGAMLAAKTGALDPDSPNFARDMDDFERTMLRVIHGVAAGDKIFEENKKAADSTFQWQDSAVPGVKIRRKAD